MPRFYRVVAAALLVALTATLSGCRSSGPADGDASPTAAVSSTTAANPTAIIGAAFAKSRSLPKHLFALILQSGRGGIQFQVDAGDVTERSAIYVRRGGFREVRIIGHDIYALRESDGRWLHLAITRTQGQTVLVFSYISKPFLTVLDGVETAVDAGAGRYTGTISLKKALLVGSTESGDQYIGLLMGVAGSGTTVPFELYLDSEGRIGGLNYTVNTIQFRFTIDYKSTTLVLL